MEKLKEFIEKIKEFTIAITELFVAFWYTAFYRAFILFIPFNKLKKRMGKVKQETPEKESKEVYRTAKHIAWLVRLVAGRTPWESKCLVQALTAQKMLKRRGISTTLYLGVKKENNEMKAHAWLRCGEMDVTGGMAKQGYVVVAKFAN